MGEGIGRGGEGGKLAGSARREEGGKSRRVAR